MNYSELGFNNGTIGEFKDVTAKIFDEICRLGGYDTSENKDIGNVK